MQLNLVSNQLQTLYPEVYTSLKASPKSPTEEAPSDKKEENKIFTEDTLSLGVRIGGQAIGGGFAAYKYGGKMASHYKEIYSAIKGGQGLNGALGSVKGMALTTARSAGLSALVSSGVSMLNNGLGVVRGTVTGTDAVSNVTSDTIAGAVGGLGAASLSGAGHLALSAFGVAGIPLTVGTVAAGAVGGVLMNQLTHSLQN